MTRNVVQADEYLNALAEKVEIPDSRYDSADKSYKAVAAWFSRPASRFSSVSVDVYTQGSFRLGTPIRPVSDEEHYDLDIVCEFKQAKISITQEQLQDALGEELILYAKAHGMSPPLRWDRCWTLNYADGAQFHMDILPSVPDGVLQAYLLASRGIGTEFANSAVAITDCKHQYYRQRSHDWPVSNPNGYAAWFKSRMSVILEMRKQAMLMDAKVNVAKIPSYRVKTPLQLAIQILKHHRDVRFLDSDQCKPSSIIITTLAAHAYQQETTIRGAILGVLSRMDQFVERRGGDYWIPNPSDPRENFADRWRGEPELKDALFDWLETARVDFDSAAQQSDPDSFVDVLAPRMGRRLMEDSMQKTAMFRGSSAIVRRDSPSSIVLLRDAPHRKPPVWPVVSAGTVRIASAEYQRAGFRPAPFASNGPPLPKNADLIFEAETNVAWPYRVYWQVVNTGSQAKLARMLRGGFEEVTVTRGKLRREEGTQFAGSHSIECLIVKAGVCVARSGPFIVNIQ